MASRYADSAVETRRLPPKLTVDPPLLNSASPWATDLEQLSALYHCPSTGAITTRTSLIGGFAHHDSQHQFAFFDSSDPASPHRRASRSSVHPPQSANLSASLNNLGYSPLPLTEYLSFARTLSSSSAPSTCRKPIIISVTGTPDEIAQCYDHVSA